MNNKLEMLRQQSKPPVPHNNGLGLWNNGLLNDWHREWDEKFAELIVHECIGAVNDALYSDSVYEAATPASIRKVAIMSIKKHFGVNDE